MNTTGSREKMKLIQAAAKLIKEDIKAIKTSHEVYPACDALESPEAGIDFLPDTLKALLEGLFSGKNTAVKVASIGQAIMQATRPIGSCCHHCSLGWACSYITTLHHDSSSTRFIIMGSAVHTKRCTSLSKTLLTHTELTFLT